MAYTIKIINLPQSAYPLKCTYEMPNPLGFCIHNTGNSASATSEISYMQSNSNPTSYHYAIDDKYVIRGLPLNRNGWHAGDGSKGNGNRNYIGVEICYSTLGGEKYKQAEQNAVDFIAMEMVLRGWTDVNKVIKKHQDFSGKVCPHRIIAENRWGEFKQRIDSKRREYLKPNDTKPVVDPTKPVDKIEVPKVKGVYISSINDFSSAELVVHRLKSGLYLPPSDLSNIGELYVVGGEVPKDYKGKVVNLSGSNRFETAQKVKEFLYGK